jgi:hypothetical protein
LPSRIQQHSGVDITSPCVRELTLMIFDSIVMNFESVIKTFDSIAKIFDTIVMTSESSIKDL